MLDCVERDKIYVTKEWIFALTGSLKRVNVRLERLLCATLGKPTVLPDIFEIGYVLLIQILQEFERNITIFLEWNKFLKI